MNLLTKFSVGQYVYGNRSWLRIIDSRLKIIIVMIFLITPIWAGPIWRLSLVGFLLLITFLSLLPSRVWWRSLFFLSCLSLLIGCISTLASSDIQSLDGNKLIKLINSKQPTKLNLHIGPAHIGVIRNIITMIIFNLLSIILSQLLLP